MQVLMCTRTFDPPFVVYMHLTGATFFRPLGPSQLLNEKIVDADATLIIALLCSSTGSARRWLPLELSQFEFTRRLYR